MDVSVNTHPIVRFRNIDKTYDGETNILDSLNLDIERGEFVTLLGPSGSGKSTLLMILAGFEEVTGGEVLLNNERLNNVPAHKRNMGVVFQSYALFPHMSVRKNVAYPLVQRGVPKAEIEERASQALEMIHMSDFGDRMPSQLSGGQQQRVALARAIVYQPEVILMDEPLGALDKKLREKMQIEIKHLHEMLGTTVVFVTHDQSEALTMSDRIAVFNDGIILQIGPPDEIYERPNCSFVANFIGEMNNFSGRVQKAEGGICTVKTLSGHAVQGLNVLGARTGQEVSLAVRPENMTIDTAQPADGGLPAKITGVIYHGDHIRYELEVEGAHDISARSEAEIGDALPVGNSVYIQWDVEKGRVLDPLADDGARGNLGGGKK